MILTPGVRLGPYEIVAPLGAGGMGEVYRARDSRLGRDVAIKVLAGALADPARLHRFEQEARSVAALSHPNIVALFDVGNGDPPFLVTELLDGETLRARLGRGPLPIANAIDIAMQLVAGLAAAHGRGMVHRDLKPENVFLTSEGVVKILDFGLAKTTSSIVAGSSDVDVTRASAATINGTVLGTIGYMAPEQVRGTVVDQRSDIFAVGALLYEMVTGRRAFHGESPADTMSAILREQPTQLTIDGAMPPSVSRIVRRCLEKAPHDRFQSARDLRFALESMAGDRPAPGSMKTDGKSIAVLPFANMSGDPENEYFSDGLAEELINALARLPGLRVAARTSAFQFRGRSADIREIGRQLNVDHVLEGSVRRAGHRLRVTAQLITVSDGYHRWSERYDREMADVFDIQDDIASSIVKTIEPTLVGQAMPVARRHSQNVAAFELYLRGRHLWNQRTPASMKAAIGHFEQAIALDADYALVHAGIAETYATMALYGFVRPTEARSKAEAAAQRAMILEPQLAESHLAMGVCMIFLSADWPDANRHLAEGLRIQPESGYGHTYSAYYFAMVGRYDQARTSYENARTLDALAPFTHAGASAVFYIAKEYEEAIRCGERALELHPDFALAMYVTGLACCQLKAFDRAIDMHERLASLAARSPIFVGLLGHAYAAAGRPNDAMAILRELDTRRAHEYVIPSADLLVWAGLRDRDKTYEALVACVEEGITGPAINLWLSPYIDALATEARFAELFDRLRLGPKAQRQSWK